MGEREGKPFEPFPADTSGTTGEVYSPEELMARARIDEVLMQFPRRTNLNSQTSIRARDFCDAQIEKHGEESLITLIPFPAEIDITGSLNAIIVHNKIATVGDLTSMNPEIFGTLKGIGPKALQLLNALHGLAIVQSSNPQGNNT